uniref:Essential for reactive oxygen species protein n=1 Tax=Sus scrofa TaxID=9823 RepID=A0A5G2QHW0_PIG
MVPVRMPTFPLSHAAPLLSAPGDPGGERRVRHVVRPCLGWKLFYVSGCLFVAVQNLEDWQEAIFSKSTGKVVLKTSSLYRKLLTLCRAGHEQVVVQLSDIRDVSVEEEKVRYFGKGHVVVLRFATGFSHPLTQSAVMGHRGDVEAIARLITTFLELHRLESPAEPSQSSDSEADILGDHS